jgi:hypothetical protein
VVVVVVVPPGLEVGGLGRVVAGCPDEPDPHPANATAAITAAHPGDHLRTLAFCSRLLIRSTFPLAIVIETTSCIWLASARQSGGSVHPIRQ